MAEKGGAKFEDYDWKELPEEAKEAATKLGYTKKMWDSDKEPKCCDEYWADLNEDERQAATVLGYTAETWDKEGMLAKCCVIQ